MDEEKIKIFYQNWLNVVSQQAEGYIYNEEKNLLPTRDIFSKFKILIEKFLENQLEEYEKIWILPGIRGTGKTTLLMQLYKIERFLKQDDQNILKNIGKLEEIFYLDVSKLKLNNISLNEFFNFYEKAKGFNFVSSDRKLLLLLDEIHYDENWGLFLKVLFDSTKGHKNLFVIATGSSAISLRMNPDLYRRTSVMEVFPMKFDEFLILKYNKKLPVANLQGGIREIIFNSSNAREVYRGLDQYAIEIDKFFANLPPNVEDGFFENGGLPSTIKITNKVKATEMIKTAINSIIAKDIIGMEKFKTQTIAKIYDLLYLLANSDTISYEKIKKSLKIERFETLDSLIDVLGMAGVLIKVKSYGMTYGPVRKTPKLLFITSSLRSAILDNQFWPGIEGKKLEDYFALIYMKDLKDKLAVNLFYDISEGGADFILTLKDRSKIIIEVGFNKEEIRQVMNTQNKVKGKYGLVFGSSKLELVDDFVVKIPLKYLLLI